MRLAWSWLVLTACYSGGAVELHVAPTQDVTEVEIYGGVSEPTTEPLRPASYLTPAPAVWFTRDVESAFDVQPMTTDGVTFPFTIGSTDDFDALIFVGRRDGQAVSVATHLHQLDIPTAREVDRYEIVLAAADPLPRSTLTSAPGFQVWGSTSGRTCAQVDNVPDLAEYTGAKHAMIVRGDDPDCDGYTDSDPLECSTREYMSQRPMTRDQLDRFLTLTLPVPMSNSTPACVAGGVTCVDGAGEKPAPSAMCAPSGLCVACQGAGCDVTALDFGAIPHVDCTLPTRTNTTTTNALCTMPMEFSLHALDSAAVCDDNPGAKLRGTQPQWSDTIVYGNGTELSVAPVDPAMCKYTLKTNGGVVSINVGGTTRLAGLFSVPLVEPVAARSVLLPVVVHLTAPTGDVCPTAPVTCQIIGADTSLQACIRSPVSSGEIVLD